MQIVERSGSDVRKLDALIHALLSKSPAVASWVNGWADMSSIRLQLEKRRAKRPSTETLAAVISRQYAGVAMSDKTAVNLTALHNSDAFTVTTGHQLCILGGPAYFIYKILSTIKLAKLIQSEFPDETIVPVFWMASEDHDKEEINHIHIHAEKHEWTTPQTGAVGRFETLELESWIEENWSLFPASDLSASSKEMMLKACRQSSSLAGATRMWVNELLGEYGLVILDADDKELKRLFSPIMLNDVFKHQSFEAVAATSQAIQAAGFQTQVNPREINLFYLSTSSRVRIEQHANEWRTTDGRAHWTEQTLRQEIEEHPDRFSPNVILRPLYQEVLLPNLAYVGGPGELAYWMQLKSMFDAYDVNFPCLVLRDSAMSLTQSAQRKMEKLGLKVDDLFRPQLEITNQILKVDDWSVASELQTLETTYAAIGDTLSAIDPTLRGAVMSELQKAKAGIEHVQGKARKSLKQKEEARLSQINKLWSEIYPNQQPQERVENFFSFYLQSDENLIHALLDSFNPLENKVTIALFG